MERNDPLCVHFVFKCKYQDNAWILGELFFYYLEPYPIYQYLILSIGILFLSYFRLVSYRSCVVLIWFLLISHLMCWSVLNWIICWFDYSQSCVDLDFDIIWTTFFVSHFGVLSSWFTWCFLSKLYLIWFLKDFACIFSNIYIIWHVCLSSSNI